MARRITAAACARVAVSPGRTGGEVAMAVPFDSEPAVSTIVQSPGTGRGSGPRYSISLQLGALKGFSRVDCS